MSAYQVALAAAPAQIGASKRSLPGSISCALAQYFSSPSFNGLAAATHTAQQRGDVIRIGRQHIRDGVLTVRQQKTGVTLAIPVHPDLAGGRPRWFLFGQRSSLHPRSHLVSLLEKQIGSPSRGGQSFGCADRSVCKVIPNTNQY
jgi:hypothetical protein